VGLQEKTLYLKDISDFRQKNNCLKVFEMMKKSLHLQPQTKKNHEIFNEHNHT